MYWNLLVIIPDKSSRYDINFTTINVIVFVIYDSRTSINRINPKIKIQF